MFNKYGVLGLGMLLMGCAQPTRPVVEKYRFVYHSGEGYCGLVDSDGNIRVIEARFFGGDFRIELDGKCFERNSGMVCPITGYGVFQEDVE